MISGEGYGAGELHQPSAELSAPERMKYGEGWKKVIAELFMRHFEQSEPHTLSTEDVEALRAQLAVEQPGTIYADYLRHQTERYDSAALSRKDLVVARELYFILDDTVLTIRMDSGENNRASSTGLARADHWAESVGGAQGEHNMDHAPVANILLSDGKSELESIGIYNDGDTREEDGSSMTAEQAKLVTEALSLARDAEPVSSQQATEFLRQKWQRN